MIADIEKIRQYSRAAKQERQEHEHIAKIENYISDSVTGAAQAGANSYFVDSQDIFCRISSPPDFSRKDFLGLLDKVLHSFNSAGYTVKTNLGCSGIDYKIEW